MQCHDITEQITKNKQAGNDILHKIQMQNGKNYSTNNINIIL